LNWLSHLFSLDVFDIAILLIALAPEIDLKYERLYSYLQDDVSRRRPTVDLALNLLCASAGEKLVGRTHFAPGATLMRYEILTLSRTENGLSEIPLLSQSMKLDGTIASFLLGGEGLDRQLSGFCQIVEPKIGMEELPLPMEQKEGLARLAKMTVDIRRPLQLYLRGPQGAGQRLAAHALAKELDTT
jgi:hypothetical protein